jgi:hypothetical protein
MVTEFEVEAVAETAQTAAFDTSVSALRGVFDSAVVPVSLQRPAVDIFKHLVSRAEPNNNEQMNALKAALFNLHLPPACAAEVTGSVMAACVEGFDPFIGLVCPALPDEGMPGAAAMAVAMLLERGEAITDNFRNLAMYWFDGVEDVPPPLRDTSSTWPNSCGPAVRTLSNAQAFCQ